MSGLDPNTGGALVVPGGGGTSLPTASGAGEVPVSDGAGTAYTATTLDEVVVDGMKLALTGEPAGAALISDGAGDISVTSADVSAMLAASSAAAAAAAIGAESALPRLSVASALHHWRLDDAASPFADIGSGAASLAYVAGTREYARAGVYARYGATMQRAPAATNRCDATISMGAASDKSFGVTVSNEDGVKNPPAAYTIIAAIHDNNATPGNAAGIYILTGTGTDVYIACRAGGADNRDSAAYSMDWSRPHRLDVTYATASRVATLYVDGVARVSTAATAGTMAALTTASLGGLQNQLSGCGASALLMSDFTVHTSALSAATVLSRADVCRRLAAG